MAYGPKEYTLSQGQKIEHARDYLAAHLFLNGHCSSLTIATMAAERWMILAVNETDTWQEAVARLRKDADTLPV